MIGNKGDTPRKEIIFTGFGGQGIVLAGRILGEAAVLGDGKESTLVQSYGPEARGGACSAEVVSGLEHVSIRHGLVGRLQGIVKGLAGRNGDLARHRLANECLRLGIVLRCSREP